MSQGEKKDRWGDLPSRWHAFRRGSRHRLCVARGFFRRGLFSWLAGASFLAAWIGFGLTTSALAKSPLQFVIDNQTFVYNLEWTGIDNLAEGQTVIGNILRPQLQYHFNRRLYVEAGALLQHPFGDDDRIAETDPVLSLNYRPAPDWLITAGTIDRDHPLHDGIFWELLRFTDPIEQGFQVKADTSFLRQDLWLSWKQRETATRREKFSIGNVTQLKWKGFQLDGQVYWVHLGGQKNTGPGVFNNLSLGLGGGYSWRNDREDLRFLQSAGATVHYLYQKDEPPLAAELEGAGVAARVWMDVMGVNVYFQVWDAVDPGFHSRRGDATMPGEALAKGNPLYGADDFQEVGASKLWPLADTVYLRLDLRQQFVQDQTVEVYALTVQWREDFDLFADFFRRHWKGSREAASRPSRLQRRTPAPASRLRP